jgi:hypothetical protein
MGTTGDFRARMAAAMLNEDFQAALDRITKKKKEITSMADVQKDIITDKLEDTADYIDNFGPISTLKDYFVETKGFSEGDWSEIEKVVQKLDAPSIDAFVQYTKNPVKIDYFTSMTKTTNVINQLEKDHNLPKAVTSKIFDKEGKMKAGKGVGRGELFLGFMVDGATNASVGDVNVNGQAYEVKGKEARLNTQNGFGLGTPAMISFFNALKDHKDPKIQNIGNNFGDSSKGNIQSYNFLKGGKSKFYELFQTAHKDGIKLNDIFEILASTLFCGDSGIWLTASSQLENEVVGVFKKYVGKDGTAKNDVMLNYALMWINIKYYKTREPFNGIFIILPGTGKMAYLPVGEQDMTGWLSKNVKYNQPSWQDNPTSNCWKITLK